MTKKVLVILDAAPVARTKDGFTIALDNISNVTVASDITINGLAATLKELNVEDADAIAAIDKFVAYNEDNGVSGDTAMISEIPQDTFVVTYSIHDEEILQSRLTAKELEDAPEEEAATTH